MRFLLLGFVNYMGLDNSSILYVLGTVNLSPFTSNKSLGSLIEVGYWNVKGCIRGAQTCFMMTGLSASQDWSILSLILSWVHIVISLSLSFCLWIRSSANYAVTCPKRKIICSLLVQLGKRNWLEQRWKHSHFFLQKYIPYPGEMEDLSKCERTKQGKKSVCIANFHLYSIQGASLIWPIHVKT